MSILTQDQLKNPGIYTGSFSGSFSGNLTGTASYALTSSYSLSSNELGISDWRKNNYPLAEALELTYGDENKQTVTLTTNESLPHSLIYLKNKLFTATRTTQKLIRFNNLNNLSDYTTITFPSTYGHCEDMLYAPSKDKIYLLFTNNAFGAVLVVEVDPVSLAYNIVLNNTLYFFAYAGSFCTDNNYLYIVVSNAVGRMLKVSLTDFSVTNATITGSTNLHSIRYDGTYLYLTTASSPGKLFKVNPSTLGIISSVTFDTGDILATDDTSFSGDYVWVGLESGNGHILKVKKSDLSINRINTGVSGSSSYGTFFDGKYIWNLCATSPGTLVRINPETLEIYKHDLDTGENLPNEMVTDGQRLFITCYTNPAKIIRLSTPTLTYVSSQTGSSSSSISSSYSITSSYSQNAQTASYVSTSSWSLNTITASYSHTSSYVQPTSEILQTVSEISTFNKPTVNLLVIKDARTGGVFEIYTGSYAADNGMVFTDAAANKWKRKNDNNYINIDWYGCVQVNNQSNDIYTKFMGAVSASLSTEFLRSPAVFIPECPTGYWYYCTQKIEIDNRITIFGNGFGSHIRFFQNTGGFLFKYVTSRFSIIKDFKITQYGSTGTTTIGSNFGIECKDIIYATNITINAFGDGIYAWNDSAADPTGSDYGNTNNMRWYNCDFSSNWRHGVYLRGADSNNSIFHDCNYVSNGGCGHFDKSFLGNSVSFPHFASNGSPELSYQKGLVTYSGSTYVSTKDDNLNNLPTDTNYWYSLGTQWVSGYPYILPWTGSTTYYAATSINCDGANQYGTVLQIYHEADQPPPYVGPAVKVFGKNVTFRDEYSTAALNAGNGSLYTFAPFWVGNPGGSNTKRGYLSTSSFGLQYASSEAMLFGYNTSSKYGFITTNAAESAGRTWFTTTAMTASLLGRTTGGGENGNIALSSFAFMGMAGSRSTFRKFDINNSYSPSTSNLDYGDLFLLTTTGFTGPKPDAVMTKYLEPTVGGTKKLYTIKGYQEDILSNVSGTYQVGIDYSIATNRGVLYYVQVAASTSASGSDLILNREVLIVNRSGSVAVVRNTAVTPDFNGGSFATSSINITNVGVGSGLDDIKIEITGLPTGSNGKVHVRRIDY